MSADKDALAEIQEQVNYMYASAKYLEALDGRNIASIRLRQFADNIGGILERSKP